MYNDKQMKQKKNVHRTISIEETYTIIVKKNIINYYDCYADCVILYSKNNT